MQIAPSIELSGFVRHYLYLDITEAATLKLRLFSDGSSGIVLTSSPSLFLDTRPLPEAFIYGQITEYKDVYCQGPARLSIIVFRAHGLSRFLNTDASTLNDAVTPLSDVFGEAGRTLQRDMAASFDIGERTALFEDFVRNKAYASDDPLVGCALGLIRQHKGVIPIEQLTRMIGCQRRQLERKFNAVVGISPKKLCTIVQVHTFIRHLQSDTLTGSAYESGFYDQAHLIREFRKITGFTPSQYLRNATPLAVNFLQL